MNDKLANIKWSENIIIIDADHLDKVTFDLTVNFERMLERRIPPADLAHWLDCMALDGGIREGDNHIQAIFLHDKDSTKLENFTPSHYTEIDGKAFADHLGEFSMMAISVEKQLVDKEMLLLDIAATIADAQEVKRIMMVYEEESCHEHLRNLFRQTGQDKQTTLFSMQPTTGGNYKQELLGYSIMSALGIKGNEFQ